MSKPIQPNAFTVTSFKIAKPKPRKRRTRDQMLWGVVRDDGWLDRSSIYGTRSLSVAAKARIGKGKVCRIVVKGVPVRK